MTTNSGSQKAEVPLTTAYLCNRNLMISSNFFISMELKMEPSPTGESLQGHPFWEPMWTYSLRKGHLISWTLMNVVFFQDRFPLCTCDGLFWNSADRRCRGGHWRVAGLLLPGRQGQTFQAPWRHPRKHPWKCSDKRRGQESHYWRCLRNAAHWKCQNESEKFKEFLKILEGFIGSYFVSSDRSSYSDGGLL